MSLPLHERAALVRERLTSGVPAYACPADLDPVSVLGELLRENRALRGQLAERLRGLREDAEAQVQQLTRLHEVAQPGSARELALYSLIVNLNTYIEALELREDLEQELAQLAGEP